MEKLMEYLQILEPMVCLMPLKVTIPPAATITYTLLDSDGDSIIDALDVDDDGDGVNTIFEVDPDADARWRPDNRCCDRHRFRY